MTVGADGLVPEVSPTSPVVIDANAPSTQPVVTGESQTQQTTTTTPTPPVEDSTKPPRNAKGRFEEKPDAGPDPVKEALDALCAPDTSAKDQAKDPSPPKSAKPAAIEKASEPDASAAKPDALTTDPLADYDDRERAALRGKTRERVETLHHRWRESEQKRQEEEPLVAAGKEYTSLLDEFNIRHDVGFVPAEHLAGLIKVQAGINRAQQALAKGQTPSPADLQSLELLAGNVAQLQQRFGIQAPVSREPAAVKPHEGELTQDMRDLVDLGIDEKDVRLLAAIKGRQAPPVTPPAPVPQQAPPAPSRAPMEAPSVTVMEAAYARKLETEVAASGITDPNHMNTLMAEARKQIMKDFSVPAAQVHEIFNTMSARERYEMLTGINRSLGAKPTATSPPPVKLSPPVQSRSLSGNAPRKSAHASSDPVIEALDRLC